MLFDKIKIYSEDILKMWCFISKYTEIVMIEDFLYKRKGQCNMVQSLARNFVDHSGKGKYNSGRDCDRT